MSADPKCSAVAAAKERKGWSYSQIAAAVGSSEQRVTDIISGKDKPTNAEFDALARALDIKANVPHAGVHSTK